ncbi:DegT/DnrJ/EryC1/StrS family aminotransferase [Oxalobacteraceae bacterium A2-2]
MDMIDLKTQYRLLRGSIGERIARVLEHGQYILGPEVAELEQRLAEYTGARHCITVASGTEALLIALMALDLRPGDEVVTTPFSFIATAEAIVLLGGRPVFADVSPDTGNLDPGLLERHIGPRTRAILPVSLYGVPADMDAIAAVAAAHGLPVIEDGAQSLGAHYHGRRSGNLSLIGCTSFFPSKPLGCYGDGGALFTSDERLARAAREIRVHGQSQRYHHTRIGVGGRMDTLQCAIVLAKLEVFEQELAQRQAVAQRYQERFAGRVSAMTVPSGCRSAYAQYTVRLARRTPVQEALRTAGIPSAVHYPLPIHRQPAYQHYAGQPCPVADQLAAEVLSLPMSPYLDPADVDRVADTVLAAVAAPGAPAPAGCGPWSAP